MRSTIACSALVAALAVTAPAQAQPTAAERGMADALFREGKRLLAEGRIVEACGKLAASDKLDRAGGTLLNLAMCHELEGRTATAYAEFQEALAMAKSARRDDREQAASEHLAALEPRLSKLTIVLAANATPGILVKLDGVEVTPSAFGVAVPVDPGKHAVAASADGKKRWDVTVDIREAEARNLTVPRLEDVEVPHAPPPRPAPKPLPPRRGAWKAPLGATMLAVGAGGLAAGISFGVRAIDLGNSVAKNCPGMRCNNAGLSALDDGRTAANVSNVSLGVGAGLAVAGGVLLAVSAATAKADGRAGPRLEVRPAVGPGVAFASLVGSW